MSWTGKAVGALLGLLTRRWQFVLLGVAIGHLFDLGLFRRGPTPTASDADIEAAYRRLIAQYHPDRVAGAAPEILALAESRAQAINTAYGRIQKIRRS
jgi:DnaJ-domain-containing protein 1